jgi:hypothetical protein
MALATGGRTTDDEIPHAREYGNVCLDYWNANGLDRVVIATEV